MAYTKEQIEKARNTDIIDFLQSYQGFTFKQTGKYYKCKEHNSLVIYSDRKGFIWNSKNIHGNNAIDFLEKVDGVNFLDAVKTLIGEDGKSIKYTTAKPENKTPKKLVLPEKEQGKYSRVFAYLTKSRCISPDIVSDMIKSHHIYQDTKGNCVFVGYDNNGTAKFASVRGTLTGKQFRGDCENSDKRYAFCQIGEEKDRIYIFEAPIDLMSHCTMVNKKQNSPDAYKKQTRLSLCSSSDVALEAFLERHKEVKVLNFRLDNDEAGHLATQKFKEKYEARGYTVNAVFGKGKDVNEDLVNMTMNKAQTNKPMKR